MMDEKAIRLEEVSLLEQFLVGHGITGGAVPGYVQRRREAIEVDFAEPQAPAQAGSSVSAEEQEALDYIVSRGYTEEAARSILAREGVETILANKSAVAVTRAGEASA